MTLGLSRSLRKQKILEFIYNLEVKCFYRPTKRICCGMFMILLSRREVKQQKRSILNKSLFPKEQNNRKQPLSLLPHLTKHVEHEAYSFSACRSVEQMYELAQRNSYRQKVAVGYAVSLLSFHSHPDEFYSFIIFLQLQ